MPMLWLNKYVCVFIEKGIHLLLTLMVCASYGVLYSQESDTLKGRPLKEITVTAFREKELNKNSMIITSLQMDSLDHRGDYNLTERIARVPGVNMLSTGLAITKPVIRGLYGNRILVLLSGLKFDNQQWQEEHGLGLSDIGVSKVELIKGPVSVLYGSEAMGGVINILDERPAEQNQQQTDISVKLHSNTYGGMLQAGHIRSRQNKWFRIRAALENNADYSDGNGNRVLNSRFDGYYLKTAWGIQRNRWSSVNNFSSSFNRFGFIFNDIYSFVFPDARQSRNLNINPAHLVLLNVFSSENKWFFNKSTLLFNAGVQSNERMENEGGGTISLNMHLLTFQYLLKWEKKLSEHHTLILSNLFSIEQNSNYGARKIVPDALMQESNGAIYLETTLKKKFTLENGISVGEKWIRTFYTPTVNGQGKESSPSIRMSPFYNVYSGLSYLPTDLFNLKVNLSSGVRAPNLAELSSDGLHEGIYVYEIGSPLLKNEQNLAFNLAANFTSTHLDVFANLFYTYFFNYIYLAPVSEQWYGFPVNRYLQQDVRQSGTEVGCKIKPFARMQINLSYFGMDSKTPDGKYTPYIPAQKISSAIQYSQTIHKTIPLQLHIGGDYCLPQYHVYPGEPSTGDYFILQAGIFTVIEHGRCIYDLGINGNNLLNKAYYDHLSRFKYYGLLNMGRNITLSLKFRFKKAIQS